MDSTLNLKAEFMGRSQSLTDSRLQLQIDIDDLSQIMTIRVSGYLDKSNALEMLTSVKQKQNRLKNYDRLYDLTKVDFHVSIAEFEDVLVSARNLFRVKGQQHKVAFFSDDPYVLQLVAIFKTLSQRYSYYQVDYFNTQAKAMTWLLHKEDK
ncbi:MAG: hypothetical protein V2I33_13075 [Kangiellaceae bacterium]|jgi:hypothetical protein|nr:hypothetical protein [Kangiellaceae bacterium]